MYYICMTLIQMKSFTQFLTRCVSISAAEESQGADTIVECHHNDISSVCDLLSVVQVVVQEVCTLTTTKQEATTIDEHHNRQICRHCKGEGVKPHRVNDDRIVIFECTIPLTYFFCFVLWIRTSLHYQFCPEGSRCSGRDSLHCPQQQ